MGFFHRNKREVRPCPRCHQLLESDVLVCDMCGFDMRELEPATTMAAGSDPAPRAADGSSQA